MLFRQYLDRDPVIAVSYLFGCPTKGIGAVVDPLGDIGRYLKESEEGNVAIRYVIDTHMHADHVSSGRELAEAAGAEYVLLTGTDTNYAFRGVKDGDILHMGNTEVEVLHTPGHTPEHISLVVTDHARADEPWLVVTGHTLMVSDMGRTEWASSAEEGAKALFRSAEKLRRLPDHLGVFPGAFSGSVCGRGLSGNPSSTIGFERRHNRAFALENEDEFIKLMLEEIPVPPLNAARIRATNLGLDLPEL
ncbi:MAG: MBL fold metallo-hydrolase [Acidobacteria bacterium]|nr:MAG: MBL fold metallo-hydrolase [Acidobacteriota bacterium]